MNISFAVNGHELTMCISTSPKGTMSTEIIDAPFGTQTARLIDGNAVFKGYSLVANPIDKPDASEEVRLAFRKT